jgi:DNA-binding transcriptional LysR family regulator
MGTVLEHVHGARETAAFGHDVPPVISRLLRAHPGMSLRLDESGTN